MNFRSIAARRLEWGIVTTVVVFDQVTKSLVDRALELHESLPLVPDLLALTRVHNTGAAFGIFNRLDFAGKSAALIAVSSLALVGVAAYALMVPLTDRLARIGAALILGGAVGNLIDRATAGYVLDFVDASWRGWHFWAFNVADASITIGVIFMILDILGLGRRASDPV